MCSVRKPSGGETRRSSVSKPGVLDSDGSWDEDLSGWVCSESPSDPGKKKICGRIIEK